MKKKNYEQPCICMIAAETTPILAGSYGLQGKTSNSEADAPDITYGGDADKEDPDDPNGSGTHYEVW